MPVVRMPPLPPLAMPPPDEPVPAQELTDHVASQLASYKRPRDVRYLDRLPRNDMGKILKRELG